MNHLIGICDGPLGPAERGGEGLLAGAHGARCSFLGVTRDEHHGKGVTHLVYDCYQSMAERVLADLAVAAARATGDASCRIACWHGTGHHAIGDTAVAIHVASAHRVAAFNACRAVIERLKEDLPIWKHEFYADGSDAWLQGS